MSTEKIVELVAKIVEPDESARAELTERVEKRREAGLPVAGEKDEFDWKAWAVDFAYKNPLLAVFAPVGLGLYVFLVIQLVMSI